MRKYDNDQVLQDTPQTDDITDIIDANDNNDEASQTIEPEKKKLT